MKLIIHTEYEAIKTTAGELCKHPENLSYIKFYDPVYKVISPISRANIDWLNSCRSNKILYIIKQKTHSIKLKACNRE